MFNLYNTWKRAKNMFVKPSLKVYFGKWKNDPNLPMWRTGAIIYLTKRSALNSKTHIVKDSVMIPNGFVDWEYCGTKSKIQQYCWTPKHKLPGKLKAGNYVWNSKIRRKLRKWHLSWIPPVIYLPIWTRFRIINQDVMWKYKYDDIRYEFPPQFTIVVFGLSLTFTLHSPIYNEFASDDRYWEAILNHIYENKSGSLKETIELCGIWTRLAKSEVKNYFSVRPEYITSNYLEEYYAAISEIKRLKEYEEDTPI